MLSMAEDRHIFLSQLVSLLWFYFVIASQLKSTNAEEKVCSVVTFTTDTSSIHASVNKANVSSNYSINVNGTSHIIPGNNLTISSLTPGSEYNVLLQFNTNDKKHQCNGTIWTKPEAPGQVTTNVPLPDPVNQTNQRIFNITFTATSQYVENYTMSIETAGASCTYISATSFKCGPLTPYTEYNYSLTAYNGNNDSSKETKGRFKTSATAPSIVTDVSINTSTYNATIKWKSPEYPNGNISHYSISVKALDGDYDCDFCFSCLATVAAVTNNHCHTGNTSYSGTCSTVEEGGNCSSFSVQLENLLPYTNYNISILAVNEKGRGNGSHETFMTLIGVAKNVSNVRLSSDRNTSTGLIDLTVTWTGGAKAGPTTYNLTLDEISPYTSEQFSSTQCEGQKDTTCVITNVTAFWCYKAHVQARTDVGGSQWVPSEKYRTVETNPGVVQNLTVVQDTKEAQRFNVSFECPIEGERNGNITQFIISHILLGQNGEHKNVTERVVGSTGCKLFVIPLTGLKAENNYSVAVQAKNTYNGTISNSEIIYVKPKKPKLMDDFKTSSALIMKRPGSKNEITKIGVTVCAQCLLNASQGEVQNVGLLVCVKGVNNPCNTTETNYTKPGTWAKAKSRKFAEPYRTTPDNWKETLARHNDMNYTIGDDSNCATELEDHFCNGPLPRGKTVIVSVIVCTKAGCDSVHSDDFTLSKDQENSYARIITGVVLGTMMATLVVCFIIFFIFRKKPAFLFCFNTQVELEPEISHNRPIKMRDFEDRVTKLHKDSNLLFQDEFEQIRNLCMTFKTSCNEAQREANRIKNRYVDILPYDHSRVRLDVQPEDDETNDFINANYIPGLNSVREYIATQGPMHCTVPDFWRMAWEQKCHIIVMLSDLQEGGKLKVDQYWPENLNEPVHFENVIVEVTNFSQLNKYIIRNFRITKGDEVRKVIQFFLPGWWDFSANLNFDDVIEFVQMVRQAVTPETAGPIIVHCSAGVGRTGTLIALDYFMQFVEKGSLNDEMDIFNYVLQMRKNRTRMVQAESQYIFIFDALREVIKKKIAIEEGRLSQNHGSSPGEQIEPTANETTCVTIPVEVKKCAYNNAAFEPENVTKVANETMGMSTSQP